MKILTLFDIFKHMYLGLSIGLTIFYPAILGEDWWDRVYNRKQLIINIIFPLTLIMYPVMYIGQKISDFIVKLDGKKVIFKINSNKSKKKFK